MDDLLDVPLDEVPLAFLDLEMTGLLPEEDRICELAIDRVIGGESIASLLTLVRPDRPVGASRAIHGIEDHELSEAPRLIDLAPQIAQCWEGAILISHRVEFDLAFLEAAHARGELPAPPPVALDTHALARRALRPGSVSLASLAEDLDLPRPAHRAGPDVITTRALWAEIVKALRPRTARDLQALQELDAPATLRSDIAEVLDAAKAGRVAARICYRVPGRPHFVDELEVWARRGPHVEGWLRRKNVRRVLRGDRILWAELSGIAADRPLPEPFESQLPVSRE